MNLDFFNISDGNSDNNNHFLSFLSTSPKKTEEIGPMVDLMLQRPFCFHMIRKLPLFQKQGQLKIEKGKIQIYLPDCQKKEFFRKIDLVFKKSLDKIQEIKNPLHSYFSTKILFDNASLYNRSVEKHVKENSKAPRLKKTIFGSLDLALLIGLEKQQKVNFEKSLPMRIFTLGEALKKVNEYFDQDPNSLKQEGIFRGSVKKTLLDKFTAKFIFNNHFLDEQNLGEQNFKIKKTELLVTNFTQRCLAELSPILEKEQSQCLKNILKEIVYENSLETVKENLRYWFQEELDKNTRFTLKELFSLLIKIKNHKDLNKMGSSNLAITPGGTILTCLGINEPITTKQGTLNLKDKEKLGKKLEKTRLQMQFLIDHAEEIFL